MKKKVLSVLLALLMVLGVFMPLATAALPAGPTTVSVSIADGARNVVSWTTITDAISYDIMFAAADNIHIQVGSTVRVPATVPTPAIEQFDLTGSSIVGYFVPDTQYVVWVRAVFLDDSYTDWTDSSPFTFQRFAPVPTIATNPNRTVTWTPVPGTSLPEIQIFQGATLVHTVLNASSPFNLNSLNGNQLTPGLTYQIRIRVYVHNYGFVSTNTISAPATIMPGITPQVLAITGDTTTPISHGGTRQLSWSLTPPTPGPTSPAIWEIAANPAPTAAGMSINRYSGLISIDTTANGARDGFFYVRVSMDNHAEVELTSNLVRMSVGAVTAPPTQTISISGTSTALTTGSQRYLSANLGGVPLAAGQRVAWSATNASGSAATILEQNNGLTARLTAGANAGSVTLIASIMQGTNTVAISTPMVIEIQVPRAINVTSPTGPSHSINLSTTFPLTATVTGGAPNETVTWTALSWSVSPGSSGTDTSVSNNTVIAGTRPGTLIVEGRTSAAPYLTVQRTILVGTPSVVTFNLNNGTWPSPGTAANPNPILSQETIGTFATAIAAVQENGVPRRLGFVFDGWYTHATAGERVLPERPITGNTTLWARWSTAPTTTTVPATATVGNIFPDQNLAARVAASLNATFGITTVTTTTSIRANDLAQIRTLNLERAATAPIVDLRGIANLTGVTEVTPSTGLTNQTITLPAAGRTFPLNHTNVVRNGDGTFIAPANVSNTGAVVAGTTPANNTIRWTTVPPTVFNLTYTWNIAAVRIGSATDGVDVLFSGTATLPLRAAVTFTDVNSNNWFYAAVNFVAAHGYMSGTGNNLFEPNRTLTRAEVAVILHRMAGSPSVTGPIQFTDVTATWQVQAINWAARNNIVNGIGNNLFAPNASVTREQFAAMFHRFAVFSEVDVTVPGNVGLTQFADHAQVSAWAVPYMRWATHSGLITGTTGATGNLLNPGGTASRAECAQMIQRFATTINN